MCNFNLELSFNLFFYQYAILDGILEHWISEIGLQNLMLRIAGLQILILIE